MMHEVFSPPIPFSIPILNGLPHKAKIEIEGVPFQGPQQNFTIELYAGHDIAMHLNARFGLYGQHNVVINSMRGGAWMNEEHHCNIFHVGQHFHMKITSKEEKIKININGEKIHFHHRMSPHHITSFGIKGDVSIQRVHFDNFHEHCFSSVAYGHGPGVYGAPGMPVMGMPGAPGMYPPPPAYGAPPPVYGVPGVPPVVVLEDPHHHHHDHHHGHFGFEHHHDHHHGW